MCVCVGVWVSPMEHIETHYPLWANCFVCSWPDTYENHLCFCNTLRTHRQFSFITESDCWIWANIRRKRALNICRKVIAPFRIVVLLFTEHWIYGSFHYSVSLLGSSHTYYIYTCAQYLNALISTIRKKQLLTTYANYLAVTTTTPRKKIVSFDEILSISVFVYLLQSLSGHTFRAREMCAKITI